MAKRKPLTRADVAGTTARGNAARIIGGVALAWAAAGLVIAVYHPADSVVVEDGGGLWVVAVAIPLLMLAVISSGALSRKDREHRLGGASDQGDRPRAWWRTAEFWIVVLPWAIAGWVALAAVAGPRPANLRAATNEVWVWVAAAAWLTASRLLGRDVCWRRVGMALVAAIAVGLSVAALYQHVITQPSLRAEFARDPDAVIAQAGLQPPPPNSAERLMFASRLLDGGPTATFALANSLAGYVLVGWVLVAARLRRWRSAPVPANAADLFFLAVLSAALLATSSRSAILAAAMAGIAIIVTSSRGRGFSKLAGRFVVAGAAAGLVVTLLVVLVGRREWIDAAPASIETRLHYWRSTWSMALDHPLFGVGPGQYQSFYGRYRDESMGEVIAEPHNFWFETLAAGGFPAALALSVLIGIVLWRSGNDRLVDSSESALSESSTDHPIGEVGGPMNPVWVGAGVGLVGVWLLAYATATEEDLPEQLWAVSIAIAAAWHFGRNGGTRPVGVDENRRAAALALAALGLHLCFSGGWTVPGLAVLVWTLAGWVLPRSVSHVRSPAAGLLSGKVRVWLLGGVSAAILAGWWFGSWVPVRGAAAAMGQATAASRMGIRGGLDRAIEQAVAADPLSTEAALWNAGRHRQDYLRTGSSPARDRWLAELDRAVANAGRSPAVLRQVGIQRMQSFQVTGRREDLIGADEAFAELLRAFPSNQWAAAQRAATAAALGDADVAVESAIEAIRLGDLTANPYRMLGFQSICVPRRFGVRALDGPVRQPANDWFEASGEPLREVIRRNPR